MQFISYEKEAKNYFSNQHIISPDINEFKTIKYLSVHDDSVNCFLELKENIGVSCSRDSYIVYHDLAQMKPILKFKAHQGGVNYLIKTEDNLLISCGEDSSIKIWEEIKNEDYLNDNNKLKEIENKAKIEIKTDESMKKIIILENNNKFLTCSHKGIYVYEYDIKNLKINLVKSIKKDKITDVILFKNDKNNDIFIIGYTFSSQVFIMDKELNIIKEINCETPSWQNNLVQINNEEIILGNNKALNIINVEKGIIKLSKQTKEYINCLFKLKDGSIIRGERDGIRRYYVFDGKLDENKFDAKERKHVIKLGSIKHKLLFLKSDKILSSFVNTQHYSPFDKKLKYYKDIFRFDLIYLQYGILQSTAIKKYSKEFTPIDKIVISSKFEENNFIENYNYSKNDLLKSGMPRFDEINKNSEIENKIIFAPSWREYLIGGLVNKKRKIDINRFINSDYYKNIVEFLKNEKLQNIKLSEYKAFITDFSSYQFDFVNLVRPICYFIPDIKEFKAGLHSYKELDLKYEDAFGKLCLTSEEVVDEVIKIIGDDFKLEKDCKKRMENFFFKIDNCKDTLYKLLKED